MHPSLTPHQPDGCKRKLPRRLRLNAPRLTRMRREVISGLRDGVMHLVDAGVDFEEAARQVSSAMFPDSEGVAGVLHMHSVVPGAGRRGKIS